MKNPIGILQGRLTPSNGRGIQFFPDDNWEQEFAIAKQIGFDCMELLVKETNFKENPLFSESGKKTIRKLAKKHSLETPSIHGFYSKEIHYPATLVELLRFGKEVGARTVLVSFSHENVLKNENDKKLALKQLEPGVKEAEKIGSRVAIETEMLAPELKTFIESFQSNAVGIYYDIGNMVSLNADVPMEITFLANLIFGVHIKDRKRNRGKTVPIGTGDTNFPVVFKVFKKIDYKGSYIMQGARSETINDIILNSNYFEYIKKIIKKN